MGCKDSEDNQCLLYLMSAGGRACLRGIPGVNKSVLTVVTTAICQPGGREQSLFEGGCSISHTTSKSKPGGRLDLINRSTLVTKEAGTGQDD